MDVIKVEEGVSKVFIVAFLKMIQAQIKRTKDGNVRTFLGNKVGGMGKLGRLGKCILNPVLIVF